MIELSTNAEADLTQTLLDGADVEQLFSPVTIAGLKLRNRWVMAPMTRQFSPDGVPDADVAAYYGRRAASLGLLVTEGTYVDESAGPSDRVPRFFGEASLAGWRKVADAVHAADGAIFPQLWHLGAGRKPGSGPYPDAPVISPSGIDAAGNAVAEPAAAVQLEATAAAFARAAAAAKDAGFDGVELHGAHGYLLDQFHWSATNRRTDVYGGDIKGRARFSAEVVAAVRAATGPDFPIAFRFSQWKGADFNAKIAADPAELEAFLAPLTEAGVSIFHASTRRYWLPAFDGSDRTLAGWTRDLSGLPVIAVGSVGVPSAFRAAAGEGAQPTLSLALLVDLLERGEFDLVAAGRAVLADPQWAAKVAAGRLPEIRPYDKSLDAELY
ncbi:MAG: NADH:flavin oxidoreductase/NADH oxidase [Actinomycetia bacterium]|jgi:2,4-dienoyl-CoA reductase-like NADH-dependent reductase (Old Yellow Enzyme family)|nr:NADH:flavin oxidoreductase/NADH oxidase [Actinomycetes bacterium]